MDSLLQRTLQAPGPCALDRRAVPRSGRGCKGWVRQRTRRRQL